MYRAKKAWEVRIPEEVPHKIAVIYGKGYGFEEEVDVLDEIYTRIQQYGCHDRADAECNVCINDQTEYRRLYNNIMKKGTEKKRR